MKHQAELRMKNMESGRVGEVIIAIFGLDSWNLVPKTGSTQRIRILCQKLRLPNMIVHFREIKNLKSTKKMGRPKKTWKNKGSK